MLARIRDAVNIKEVVTHDHQDWPVLWLFQQT